eukprot:689108-Amorphochlora_amoeboformis.AAC.1
MKRDRSIRHTPKPLDHPLQVMVTAKILAASGAGVILCSVLFILPSRNPLANPTVSKNFARSGIAGGYRSHVATRDAGVRRNAGFGLFGGQQGSHSPNRSSFLEIWAG